MALTDENVQELQKMVLEWSKIPEKKFSVPVYDTEGNTYQIIHAEHNAGDNLTQAIAVAPVVNGKTDYSQTAIVVAGTQPLSDMTSEAFSSTGRAVDASGFLGIVDGHLTKQYQEISDFYDATEKKLAKHQGTISNMSGFSQSGPPVAKKAAKEALEDKSGKKTIKITNFMDWGSVEAVNSGDITKEEKSYIDKHAHIYSDQGKDLTSIDGNGGKIAYGKVYTVEGKSHAPSFPHIKGNGPDYDYYIKKGEFVSGMTKAQVIAVAKKKAKNANTWNNPETWFGSTDYQTYVDEYEKTYGPFASEGKDITSPTSFSQKLTALRDWRSRSGGVPLSVTGAGVARMLSKNQKIFLDSAQSMAVVEEMASQARSGADKIKAEREAALEEALESLAKLDYSGYTELSYEELEAIFAEEGVTEAQVTADVTAAFQEAVSTAETAASGFETLKSEVASGIQKMLEADAGLAGDFNQWTAELSDSV